MKPANRCLVPVTSFCEYAAGKPAVPHWFALGEDRPLFAFAGLWRPWTGRRGTKAEPVEGAHELFAFLTCEPNAVVAPIHPKAMLVILTTAEECDAWLAAPIDEALHLQRPLADGLRSIIAPEAKSRTRHLAVRSCRLCCFEAGFLSPAAACGVTAAV